MVSASVETMILFIAGLVVAASVAGVLTSEVQRISSAIDDQGLDVSEEVRTDIEIISDAGSDVYNTSGDENVTLYVKNTGSQKLSAEASQVEVLVDGSYEPDVSVSVVDGSEWDTDNVVEIRINESLASGDHRIKVIVNGDEEVFEFRT